jgi:hypothetical protein
MLIHSGQIFFTSTVFTILEDKEGKGKWQKAWEDEDGDDYADDKENKRRRKGLNSINSLMKNCCWITREVELKKGRKMSPKFTLWFCIRFICRTEEINEESSHEIRFRETERDI